MNLAETLRQVIPSFPEAKCQDLNPNFMFPDTQEEWERRLPEMEAVCMSCVHRFECGDLALKERIRDGMWGGLSESERRAILRREGVGDREGVTYVSSQDRLPFVMELYRAGKTRTAIAKELGIDFIQVDRVVQLARKQNLL